jgi:hypothetical protein
MQETGRGDNTVERPEKEYIQMMSDRRLEHYRKYYDIKDNEWILQELDEWADEVQIAATLACEQGRMTKKEMQETVVAARSAWSRAREEIEEYEREEGYIRRLCGSD